MSKKIIISKEELSDINIYTRRYEIRYRITNEERSKFSYWTPIFSIDPELVYEPGTLEIRGEIRLEKLGSSSVSVTWDSVSIYKNNSGNLDKINELEQYDVWIRWADSGGSNPGEWIHKERVSTTSVNINIPSQYAYQSGGTTLYAAPKYVYVEIYRPGRPIERFEETRSFPQTTDIVDIANDYFVFPTGHGTVTATPGLYLSTTPIGGLSNNTTYYTRTIDYFTISLHPTKQDALDNTNKINLTGTPSGTGSFTGYTFRIYDGVLTNI